MYSISKKRKLLICMEKLHVRSWKSFNKCAVRLLNCNSRITCKVLVLSPVTSLDQRLGTTERDTDTDIRGISISLVFLFTIQFLSHINLSDKAMISDKWYYFSIICYLLFILNYKVIRLANLVNAYEIRKVFVEKTSVKLQYSLLIYILCISSNFPAFMLI